ncbi:MAG: protein kinase domain-containing protein [Thermoplasmatota archaeon]
MADFRVGTIAGADLLVGAILIFLAVFIAASRFSSRVHQVFSLLLISRGAAAFTEGLMKASPNLGTATYWADVSIYFEILSFSTLVSFVAIFPRRTRAAQAPLFWFLLAGGTLAVLGYYASDHAAFVDAVLYVAPAHVYGLSRTPLLTYLFAFITLSQSVILVALARAYARSESEIARRERWYVLAALGVSITYNFGFSVSVSPYLVAAGAASTSNGVTTLLAGVVGIVVSAVVAWRLIGSSKSHPETHREVLRLFGLLLAALLAGVIDAAVLFALPRNPVYQTSSELWRLLFGLLIAYGMLRYTLFDLEVRMKRTLAGALTFGFVALLFAAVTVIVLAGLGPSIPTLVLGQIVGAGAVVVSYPTVKRSALAVAGAFAPEAPESAGEIFDRKLEVYRAALERALDQGRLGDGTPSARVDPQERASLAELRKKLGITEREHVLLEQVVRRAAPSGVAGEGAFAPGALVLGKYRIEGVLGEGTFGRTYLARDADLARAVALKHVTAHSKDEVDLVLREVRVLAALRHPNIIQLLDVERLGDDVFLVLEYADGGSIGDRLRDGGPLPLPEAVALIAQVLEGLAAAHATGVVHRDVKPANLLLDRAGLVKLGDFGLARSADVRATRVGLGAPSAAEGTPAYMAPEQARGATADARSDLFAVAASFYEMIEGRPYLALEGKTEFEVRTAILVDAPRLPLDHQPRWVTEFLTRGLAKDPGLRFQSAAEMRAALVAGASALLVRVDRASELV